MTGLAMAVALWALGAPATAPPLTPPAPAQATPAAPRKLSREEARRFRGALLEARKAAKKGNHAAAMAAYDRALAVLPDDPRVLTDQGWSAFQLKDLARAEAITRKATAVAHEKRLLAAGHYNLGRILEARNDRAGAIAQYERSLQLRPNRVVREQLGKLDPAAAAAADPLKPAPMQGPFASLADYCKTLGNEEERELCPLEDSGQTLPAVEKPYKTVRWFMAGRPTSRCLLALQLPAGWYVHDLDYCQDQDFMQGDVLGFALADLVPGGAKEVVMRSSVEIAEREPVELDMGVSSTMVTKGCDGTLVICGVRAAGPPTCLSMLYGKGESCSRDESSWTWKLEPTFSDGQVDVKGTGKLDADARGLLGRRPLTFP